MEAIHDTYHIHFQLHIDMVQIAQKQLLEKLGKTQII